jgi:hypothetical protein
MDSLRSRQDKVKFLKGVLKGDVSLKDKLTPKVYTVYSLSPDLQTQYTQAGELLTPAERARLEEQAGNRPVIFVNIVCTESNTVIALPHNNRESLTAPIYKTLHQ